MLGSRKTKVGDESEPSGRDRGRVDALEIMITTVEEKEFGPYSSRFGQSVG